MHVSIACMGTTMLPHLGGSSRKCVSVQDADAAALTASEQRSRSRTACHAQGSGQVSQMQDDWAQQSKSTCHHGGAPRVGRAHSQPAPRAGHPTAPALQ